jgi:Mlc titration factor MtfA (ptsG expression regulator)
MLRWLAGRGARAGRVEQMRARIPPALWQATLARYPFLDGLDDAQSQALQDRVAWLLASKSINGARGFVPDDTVRLAIAAQAALPILNLAPQVYEGWDEIIVYRAGFAIARRHEDEDGVVHEYIEDAAGEAWDGGPVILSWEDSAGTRPGFNVVIHEFAHKLDLQAGDADGMPNLGAHRDLQPRRWRAVLEQSLDRFREALEAVESAIPAHVDPESSAADTWYDRLPLDPYAATDEAEFFAVSSEGFFVDPARLARDLPEWFELLRAYYRQDPLARLGREVPPLPGSGP